MGKVCLFTPPKTPDELGEFHAEKAKFSDENIIVARVMMRKNQFAMSVQSTRSTDTLNSFVFG